MKTCLFIVRNEDTRKVCATSATTQLVFTCSKLSIEIQEQGMKNVQS